SIPENETPQVTSVAAPISLSQEQSRVVELIPQLVDEGFMEELLVVNDDLNNAFIRYERWAAAGQVKLLDIRYKITAIDRLLQFFLLGLNG
ncbi:hypothetical protein XENOCAPTIV_012131, partial [Xenoophorus captivus]